MSRRTYARNGQPLTSDQDRHVDVVAITFSSSVAVEAIAGQFAGPVAALFGAAVGGVVGKLLADQMRRKRL